MVPGVGGHSFLLGSMQREQQEQDKTKEDKTAAELLANLDNTVLVQCLVELSKGSALQLQMAQTMRARVMQITEELLAALRNKGQIRPQEEPTVIADFLRDSSIPDSASAASGTVLSTPMDVKPKLTDAFGSSEVDQLLKQVGTKNDASSEQASGANEVLVPRAQCMLTPAKVEEKEDDDDDDDDDDDEDYEEEEDDDKLEAGDDEHEGEGEEEEAEDEREAEENGEADDDDGEDEGETEENGEGDDDDGEEGDEDEINDDEDGEEEEAEDDEEEDVEDDDEAEEDEESEEEVSEAEPPKKKRK